MKQFNKCVIAKKHGRLSILIANKCNINHDKLKCSVPFLSATKKTIFVCGQIWSFSN